MGNDDSTRTTEASDTQSLHVSCIVIRWARWWMLSYLPLILQVLTSDDAQHIRVRPGRGGMTRAPRYPGDWLSDGLHGDRGAMCVSRGNKYVRPPRGYWHLM